MEKGVIINSVSLVGRLVNDIELTSNTSVSVVKPRIAVQREFKNKQGEYESDFINLLAFKGTAEYIAKYLTKGSLVSVTGRLQTGSYEKNGQKVYTHEVVVSSIRSLEKRGTNNQNNWGNNNNNNFGNQGDNWMNQDVQDDEMPF